MIVVNHASRDLVAQGSMDSEKTHELIGTRSARLEISTQLLWAERFRPFCCSEDRASSRQAYEKSETGTKAMLKLACSLTY
mmetsp:Transcript_28992/g.70019  ORF Transcript_28992/g.70019 Transcript_28992/m.70019 type:complete len:81 (-) Transcript_28992:340-582(-)